MFIGQPEKLFGLEVAFKTNCIQVKVRDEVELIAKVLVVLAKEQILCPGATANQKPLAIYAEKPTTINRRQLRRDLADPEFDSLLITDVAINREGDGKLLKVWFAHLQATRYGGYEGAVEEMRQARKQSCGSHARRAWPAG